MTHPYTHAHTHTHPHTENGHRKISLELILKLAMCTLPITRGYYRKKGKQAHLD